MNRLKYMLCTAGLKVMLCITLTAVLLTGCGGRTDQGNKTDLSQYQTDYIGNASNVVNIAANQEYPAGYTYESIEIQSQTEPYGLTVFLHVSADMPEIEEFTPEIEELLNANASEAFDLIGNMGTLAYRNAENKAIIASYERQ